MCNRGFEGMKPNKPIETDAKEPARLTAKTLSFLKQQVGGSLKLVRITQESYFS